MIRHPLLLFMLAVISIKAPAQTPQAAAPPTPAGAHRISGRILNSTTQSPIPHATISALSEESRSVVQSTVSDADGRFSLDGLPAAKYPLTASKRGYRTAFYDEHDEFNTAIVTGDTQDTTHLLFQLPPGAVLRGIVTADGGDPVEGAGIMLFKKMSDGTHARQFDATTTDDTGSYEFANLAPGDYFVAVNATPWYATPPHAPNAASEKNPSLDVAYPITYFDSTTDEPSATAITLTPGAHERADINLHAVPSLHLRIPVQMRQDGHGIARPELRLMVFGTQVSAESGGTLDSVRTGSMTFDSIAPGRYELSAGDPPRVVQLNATASQDVDTAEGIPALHVSGTVHTAGGAPLPPTLVAILEPADGEQSGNPHQIVLRRGEFRFDAVPPGAYDFSVAGQNPSLIVTSITANGVTTSGSRVILKDRSLDLNVEAASAGGNVQGFAARDSKGFSGAMILLVPRRASAYHALVRRDQSDSDGSFMLRDAAAGQYTVIAIEEGWKLDWQHFEIIQPYLAAGTEINVPERSAGSIRLTSAVVVQPRR